MNWRIVLERDEEIGDFAVWCPELPGRVSAGCTEEDALANIGEAIELYLQPDPIDLAPVAASSIQYTRPNGRS